MNPVADGRCGCVTEQGTDYKLAPKMCRQVAAHGVYDPYDPPSANQAAQSAGRQADNRPTSGQRTARPAPVGVSDDWPHRAGVGPQSYTPPGYGSWNPTACNAAPGKFCGGGSTSSR